MKKRILAFALTLAMVITSLSMLSFVSFADDAVAGADTDVVAEDFYAYRATPTLDGKLGNDELYVPVQRKLAHCIAMGMAWDYENVYVIIYQEPSTNGVPGARKDYLENATFNVGGVAVALDWNAKTTTFPEGSNGKAVLGGTYAVEMAIPLAEITLDAEALAAGKAVIPMGIDLNTMLGETSTLVEKNYNVILTGRSVITEMNNINPVAGANGINVFASSLVYDRGTAKTNPVSSGLTQKGGNGGNGSWYLKDESTYAGKLQVFRNTNEIDEYINICDGGKNYYEFEFNIANLPAGKITTNDTITTFNNQISNLQIAAGGAHSASDNRGNLGWLYNDSDLGLCFAYYNGTATPSVIDLGADMGETFVLGIREIPISGNHGTIEFYVNDVLKASYTGSFAGYTLTQDTGSIYVSYQRGAANGHSLDIDANGTVDADEIVEFTMSGFVLANEADVDVATIASIAKNGATATPAVLTAYTAPDKSAAVNVASMTKAYAYYDFESDVVNVAVGTANIDKFNIKLGGITVKLESLVVGPTTTSRPDPVTVTIDEDSVKKGITVTTATRTAQYTIVSIPLELIYVQKDATSGEAFADLFIEVIKEDQVIQNPGKENENVRVKNETKGTWNGIMFFDRASFVFFNATISNYTTTSAAGTNKGYSGGALQGVAGGSGNGFSGASDSKFTITDKASYSSTRTYYQGNTSALGTFSDREIKFTANVASMISYDFAGNYTSAKSNSGKGETAIWSNVGSVLNHERLIFSAHGVTNADATRVGALFVEIVRDKTDGLVLIHTANTGAVTPIIIGDSFLGKNLDITLKWNADDTGEIWINGELMASLATMSTVDVPKGQGCGLSSNVVGGYSGFNFMRGKATGAKSYEWTADDILAKAAAYDSSIPFAQLAYVQESAVKADNTFSIRLLAIINTLEASEAGFAVSVKGSDVEATNYVTTTVYDSVWQTVDGERSLLVAPNGTNFLAITIPFVEAARIVEDEVVGGEDDVAPVDEAAEPVTEPVTVTYIVKPFFVSGGETTYGVSYEITYTNGVFMGAVIAR